MNSPRPMYAVNKVSMVSACSSAEGFYERDFVFMDISIDIEVTEGSASEIF